jgi:molybdopterin synthase sulfur carrier subunit
VPDIDTSAKMMPMRIEVKYFAAVREQLGTGEALVFADAATAPSSVGALLSHLQASTPLHAEALAGDRGLRMALDHELCLPDAILHDGAEVAFFPPVTGG